MTTENQIHTPIFRRRSYREQVADLGPPASLRANDSYAVCKLLIVSQQAIRGLAVRFPLNTLRTTLWYRFGLRDMSTISLTIGKRRISGRRGNISSRKESFTIIV
jgi:hypothetical protein